MVFSTKLEDISTSWG